MGKKYGNYHLQYLFDDLHVIYMFFTYYVNFQLFQLACACRHVDRGSGFVDRFLLVVDAGGGVAFGFFHVFACFSLSSNALPCFNRASSEKCWLIRAL